MMVYVHIGAHRTGTTTIQTFLRRNAAGLARGGIYVPKTTTLNEGSGHHGLPWELEGDSRFDPSRGGICDLVRELSQAGLPCAVISAEDLEYLVDQPSSLTYFEKTLTDAGHHIRYIMFVRRVDDYAESLYCVLRGCGSRVRYDSYLFKILLTGKFTWRNWVYYFDYKEFARKWRQVAREPLFVYSFDEAVAGPGILPFFLKLINAPAELIENAQEFPALNPRFVAKVPFYHRRVFRVLLRLRFKDALNVCCRGNP